MTSKNTKISSNLLISRAKGILRSILDILFPTRCLSCGASDTYICIDCLSRVRTAERESLSWVYPIYDYRDPIIKKALWVLKYKNGKAVATILADMLYGRILEELYDQETLENFVKPLLIPVPLSPTRQRERGYNQSTLICEELVDLDTDHNFTLEENILIKPRETIHQAHIKNRGERLRNIVGSFEIKLGEENKIKNRNIILIDDITTTGATLNEAKKVLKKSGARKIIAFTVAH